MTDPAVASSAAGGFSTFRRQVFYIPGYDPFPSRRYRELYRTESAAQAAISGYRIALKTAAGDAGWQLEAQVGARRSESRVDVLVWSDIVRTSMDQGIAATYLQLCRTLAVYVGSGALFRLMRLRKGPMIAALYAVVMLLGQLVIAIALAGGVAWTVLLVRDGATGTGLALVLGLVAGWLALRGFKRADRWLFAHYLMHDYAFAARDHGAYPAALEARMAAFADTIGAALDRDLDEVLVVGHSSGACLAVSILADLLRRGLPARRPALGLLSLGQVVPMLSFLPQATRLRADLALLSAQDEIAWVDVSAPGDGCAFALCDPVAVTGVAPPGKRWPLVMSAAFTRTLSPERWASLRWRFLRLHFQYLYAFDRPADYDYFQITAGPVTLADRYRGRAASKSRIETPLSGHRSLA